MLKFKKGYTKVWVLINSSSKVNPITTPYAAILKLRVCSTNVGSQKIDRSMLLTQSMVLANFYYIQLFKFSTKVCIFFVQKRDKNFRLYINYRVQNNLTIKNWYSLLLIKKLLNWVKKAKRFTQLNLISIYHYIRIKEGNKQKMAFKIWYGYYKYQLMSFHLFNALVSFWDYIIKILAKKLNIFVIINLNNIFIYIKDSGQAHINAVWYVFDML